MTNWWTVWRWFTKLLWVVGGLLTFLVLVELLRVFVFFHEVSPVLAWSYTGLLAAGLLAAGLYLFRQFHRYPRPLRPPPRPVPGEATHLERKRYAAYLLRYQQRLVRNPHVPVELARELEQEIENLSGLLAHHPLNEDLDLIIEKSERDLLPPVLDKLKRRAEREIRLSVRDVMLGVMLSPYHSIDLLIVLYRNFAMIFRIMAVYETSPVPRAQWRIVRDVVRVIATVNFLYVGRNLIENLFAFVPWVGRMADDIGQGLGAGLFTSACGHAVIDRCASYDAWEKTAATESLASQSKDFLRDVRQIFTRDVLPDIKNRILCEAPAERAGQPGFWDQLQAGINRAFDATLKTVGAVVPVVRTEPPLTPPRDEPPDQPPRGRKRRHVANAVRGVGRIIRYPLDPDRWDESP